LKSVGSLELAYARSMARHGQRVDESGWHRIEVQRDIAPLLELARGTALRPWLVGLTPASGSHAVDEQLRAQWRHTVAEVLDWMPEPWEGAVAWCAVWPDLAALQHLARGRPPPAWLRGDPAFAALLDAPAAGRLQALAAGPWRALAPAWRPPHDFAAAWAAEWQARWPAPGREPRAALLALARIVAAHRSAFACAAAGQGWAQRAALGAALGALLRRVALQPAMVFVHLALCALDLERLRAELQRRLLFPQWKGA